MKEFVFDIKVSVPTETGMEGVNKAVYDALAVVSRINLNALADAIRLDKPVEVEAHGCNAIAEIMAELVGDGDTSGESHSPTTGRWINGDDHEYEYAYCSECGHTQWADWDSHQEARDKVADFHEKYRFCPHCGARMTGGMYKERRSRKRGMTTSSESEVAVRDALSKIGNGKKG